MSKPVYLIRFVDGTFAGSPLMKRETNPEMAGCFRQVESAQALDAARALGGAAVLFSRNADGHLVEHVEAPAAKVLAFVRG